MAIGSVGGLVFELYLILNFALGGRAFCRPHRYGDGDPSVRARFRLGVSQQARTEGRLERNLVGLLDDERIMAAVESILQLQIVSSYRLLAVQDSQIHGRSPHVHTCLISLTQSTQRDL